jgi:2-iminoacetate synthase ThiH
MITKKKLIEYLESKNLYEARGDEWVIEQFMFNYQRICAVIKEMNQPDYKELIFGGGKNPDYKIQNPLNLAYDKYFLRLIELAKMMGLSAKDRKEIIKEATTINKDMEEFMN